MYCPFGSTYTISDTAILAGGITMGLESIGKHISEFRHLRKLRQEDLAEITGLSTNYIGAVERGEKIPSLETFIDMESRRVSNFAVITLDNWIGSSL